MFPSVVAEATISPCSFHVTLLLAVGNAGMRLNEAGLEVVLAIPLADALDAVEVEREAEHLALPLMARPHEIGSGATGSRMVVVCVRESKR